MPIVTRLGWLFLLTVASAQEPVSQQPEHRPAAPSAAPVFGAIKPGSALATPNPAAPRVAAPAPSPAEPVSLRAENGGDGTPPAPKDNAFSVPEAQTLLIVGAGLVLVALAKRRVRLSPVTVVR